MQSLTIGPNQAGQRFDKFLHKYLPEASSGFLYKMLRKKNITLNGKKAEGKELLKEGDLVQLFFADDTFTKFTGGVTSCPVQDSGSKRPNDSAHDTLKAHTAQYEVAYHKLKGIQVIYEDDHALILNKPSGILTQKASNADSSLNEWMIGYLLHNGSITEEELHSFKPSVCNRLDRNTSGLVLCGKSLAGSQALSKLIHDRAVRKFYRTIVGGTITESCHIEGYLVKDEKTNTVRVTAVAHEQPSGRDKSTAQGQSFWQPSKAAPRQSAGNDAALIHTAYVPLKQIEGKYTYLEVELITGKTHQIRSHLSGVGHPLLGDYKYGSKRLNEAFRQKYRLTEQLLHAYRLEFPTLKGTLAGLSDRTVTAPLPEFFIKILKDYNAEVN